MSTLGASSDESESANAADMPGFGDLDIFFRSSRVFRLLSDWSLSHSLQLLEIYFLPLDECGMYAIWLSSKRNWQFHEYLGLFTIHFDNSMVSFLLMS